MKSILIYLPIVYLAALVPSVKLQAQQDDKLHIIIIGAHPDDPDKAGGTAYKWDMMC